MNTGRRRSALSYIPGLTHNAVLKLIIFSILLYVIFSFSWAVIVLVYQTDANFNQYFIPSVALPALANFKTHWWTVFTYGWIHSPHNFWELVSNMIWLYCFGSVVQMLIGDKQVIPMFFYCFVVGGLFYWLGQLLPGALGQPPHTIGLLGPGAGLVGLAAAAITLTPKYRFYLTETFSIPLLAVAGIFAALMIIGSGFWLPVILLQVGGGFMGFAYIRLLQAGYRPAGWMFAIKEKVEGFVTPDENAEWKRHSKTRNKMLDKIYEPKHGITQKRIDDILDKINQKGYNSLSSEEKDTLMRAGKE